MNPMWTEYRRDTDRERMGWINATDTGFVAIDLLGNPRTQPTDWLDAEKTLENLGIGYLALPYEMQLPDGHWIRVRISEVSSERIKVKKEDWGAIDGPREYFELPFPAPDTLRLFEGDTGDIPPAGYLETNNS